MKKKKPLDRSIQEDQKNSENDKSEEWQNFEEAVRRIMTMPPEEAKKIREEFSVKGRRRKKPPNK
jgi:hypothetical protein